MWHCIVRCMVPHHFDGMYCIYSHLPHENKYSTFLQHIRNHAPTDAASHLRRQEFSVILLRKLQNFAEFRWYSLFCFAHIFGIKYNVYCRYSDVGECPYFIGLRSGNDHKLLWMRCEYVPNYNLSHRNTLWRWLSSIVRTLPNGLTVWLRWSKRQAQV